MSECTSYLFNKLELDTHLVRIFNLVGDVGNGSAGADAADMRART
jgi:hypothetical protein